MAGKLRSIPVQALPGDFSSGIAVGKISSGDWGPVGDAANSHRHDYHFFMLQEQGTAFIEIDFEEYRLKNSHFFYIHPNQVHRIVKIEKSVVAYIVAVSNENINPHYLEMLDGITPAKPFLLTNEEFIMVKEAVLLCKNIFEGKRGKIYSSVLKDSCNTLVGLYVSSYLERSEPTAKLSRFHSVTKAFKLLLNKNFGHLKRPSNYADLLHISVPYLNECVRNATGTAVSTHIRQRVILEARRLLVYSDKSVKEIAAELGYNDYAYFSRMFTKVAGITASTFRSKKLD